jgi:hypothetical protein
MRLSPAVDAGAGKRKYSRSRIPSEARREGVVLLITRIDPRPLSGYSRTSAT